MAEVQGTCDKRFEAVRDALATCGGTRDAMANRGTSVNSVAP
ncbi:MAG TPA: hypothetical protein VKG80_22815 [Trebonia sp.]|nr:hypothetical protein [Trebonia sp.]